MELLEKARKKYYNRSKIEKVGYYDPYLIHADLNHSAGVIQEPENDNSCDIDGVESPTSACPVHSLVIATDAGPDHHRGAADQKYQNQYALL